MIRHTIIKHSEKKLTAFAYSVNSKQIEKYKAKRFAICECDETCGVAQAHALVTFHKWGLPGHSRAVFGRPAREPEGPRLGAVHFFTRVTFNSNLKPGSRREINHVSSL